MIFTSWYADPLLVELLKPTINRQGGAGEIRKKGKRWGKTHQQVDERPTKVEVALEVSKVPHNLPPTLEVVSKADDVVVVGGLLTYMQSFFNAQLGLALEAHVEPLCERKQKFYSLRTFNKLINEVVGWATTNSVDIKVLESLDGITIGVLDEGFTRDVSLCTFWRVVTEKEGKVATPTRFTPDSYWLKVGHGDLMLAGLKKLAPHIQIVAVEIGRGETNSATLRFGIV
jgi:hypothetical protein